MNYSIENEKLKVCIAEHGAEMQSIINKGSNREYLWQGDPEIWKEQAPNLFPYIARLTDGKYTFEDKTYEMEIHGFMKYMSLKGKKRQENKAVFRLEDNDKTREQYPFKFVSAVEYELIGNVIQITYHVENQDHKTMYFGIGGHPGFQVPLEEGKNFEDYYLEFKHDEDACTGQIVREDCECPSEISPRRVVMSEDCFVVGEESYQLEEGRYISLTHRLFDHDAIVLKSAGHRVKLMCENGKNAVTLEFPGMDYLGIWHKPGVKAPYVCLEPWTSLPSRKGIIEDLKNQENLIALEPGKVYENQWRIVIE